MSGDVCFICEGEIKLWLSVRWCDNCLEKAANRPEGEDLEFWIDANKKTPRNKVK